MALTKVSRGLLTTSIVDNGNATAINIDASQNVGIGVVPSTWPSDGDYRALQIGSGLSLYGRGSGDEDRVGMTANAYLDVNNSRFEYIGSGHATHYAQTDGNHIWSTAASGSANGAISFSESMRLSSDGQLSLATTENKARMTVNLTGVAITGDTDGATMGENAIVHLHDSNSVAANSTVMLLGGGGGATGQIKSGIGFSRENASNWGTQLRFYTHTTATSDLDELKERMRISSNGNTSITATSFHPLSLDRAGQDTAGQVSVAANGTVRAYWGSNSSALLRVSNNSFTQKMLVDHSGNLTTAGSVNSDRDLKENINAIPDGSLALIQQLQPRTFNFLESFGFGTESRTGFIAQEVADVFTTDNRVVTGTDGESNMGVDPLGIIAHLTKAFQEQQATIEALTQRIQTLENN